MLRKVKVSQVNSQAIKIEKKKLKKTNLRESHGTTNA